jgi:hypothetical protein
MVLMNVFNGSDADGDDDEDMIDMAKVHAEAEKERADMLINARMPWLAVTPGWSARLNP